MLVSKYFSLILDHKTRKIDIQSILVKIKSKLYSEMLHRVLQYHIQMKLMWLFAQ